MAIKDVRRMRNEEAANQELTSQSKNTLAIRALGEIQSSCSGIRFNKIPVNVLAVIENLFDYLSYCDQPDSLEGLSRVECEEIIKEDIKSFYPSANDEEAISATIKIFDTLRQQFRLRYTDREKGCLSEEIVFRLIEHKEVRYRTGTVFCMTKEGATLYSLSLVENSIEEALAKTQAAVRILRRGEIKQAVSSIRAAEKRINESQSEMARQVTQLERRIRLVRYDEVFKNFSESASIISDIITEIQASDDVIVKQLQNTRNDHNSSKRDEVRKAKSAFDSMLSKSQSYQTNLGYVMKKYRKASSNLIAPYDESLFKTTISDGVLAPVLGMEITHVSNEMDSLMMNLLPPLARDARSTTGDRGDYRLFDIEQTLELFMEFLESDGERQTTFEKQEVEDIEVPIEPLSDEFVAECLSWVDDKLQKQGSLSFSQIINSYESGEITLEQEEHFLRTLGDYAVNTKSNFKIGLKGKLESERWSGDNVIIYVESEDE